MKVGGWIKMAKKFTYAEHIKKHTMKENTYNEDCEYCNPKYSSDIEARLKRMAGF